MRIKLIQCNHSKKEICHTALFHMLEVSSQDDENTEVFFSIIFNVDVLFDT